MVWTDIEVTDDMIKAARAAVGDNVSDADIAAIVRAVVAQMNKLPL